MKLLVPGIQINVSLNEVSQVTNLYDLSFEFFVSFVGLLRVTSYGNLVC